MTESCSIMDLDFSSERFADFQPSPTEESITVSGPNCFASPLAASQ
jgi:hypothetical protein